MTDRDTPRRLLHLDRFEDELAVLLDEDGMSHVMARTLLPEDALEGDLVELEVRTSRRSTEDVSALRRELARDDDGGDIVL